MRPHLYLTAEPIPGLRDLPTIRRDLQRPENRATMQAMRDAAAADRDAAPIVPESEIPGRLPAHAAAGNRDYGVVMAACDRMLRGAFLALIDGDPSHLAPMLSQFRCICDEAAWPDWRDLAHPTNAVDLRNGQFARAVGLAYDWAYPLLSDAERREIVDGMDRRSIRPYFQAIADGAAFTHGPELNNWHTVICGGHGILGLAFGDDHPRSAELVAKADEIMALHRGMFGPEGECNESPGYSGASYVPVYYYMARRYHDMSQGHPDPGLLAGHPYQATCHWMIHLLSPPGRMAAFGDSHPNAITRHEFFAAVADANQDSSIQAAFLALRAAPGPEQRDGGERSIMDLLTFNPALPADITLPLGQAYHAHSACISSRSSWDLADGRIAVFGKGGHGKEGHGNHDAGQLLIDGLGERLIIDLGTPAGGYPADFWGPHRYDYYNASVFGHNILMFDDQEMRRSPDDRASIRQAQFDPDRLGGYWELDTTALYDGVQRVRRCVIHCGDVVVCLDDATLDATADISLRWHSLQPAEIGAAGAFRICGERANLQCRINRLDNGDLSLENKRHEYRPPYDRHRVGVPLGQPREPYLEARCQSDRCRLLTVFHLQEQASPVATWTRHADCWTLETGDGERYELCVDDTRLTLSSSRMASPWVVQLSP